MGRRFVVAAARLWHNTGMTYSTDAIVLERADAGEADAVFVFFTKEFGKMRAYAQGVKKESAKLKGHIEPLNLAAISFVLGRQHARLVHAELRNFFPQTKESLEKTTAASEAIRLLQENCFDGEKDEAVWRLLVETFFQIEGARKEDLSRIQVSFQSKLVRVLGYGEDTSGILMPSAKKELYV